MKAFAVFALFLIIEICFAQTQFDAMGNIAPPTPPKQDLGGEAVLALRLSDMLGNTTVGDVHAQIEITDKTDSEQSATLVYVPADGIASLKLLKGNYSIEIFADSLKTKGKDYYGKISLELEGNKIVDLYMMPVGSLRGKVYEGDMALEGALVRISCPTDYLEPGDMVTDAFGSFDAKYAPAQSCRIEAMKANRAGFADIDIAKGSIANVDVKLDSEVGSSRMGMIYLIAIALMAIIVGALLLPSKHIDALSGGKKSMHAKKGGREPAPRKKASAPKQHAQEMVHIRTLDVMKTLNEKERQVAEHLLANNNKGTQAKIKNSLMIPKTSLARILHSLEKKKVAKIQRLGKLKKVELTPWFLGKE